MLRSTRRQKLHCQAYVNNNLTQDVHSLQDFFQDVAGKGVLNLPIDGKDEEDLSGILKQSSPLSTCSDLNFDCGFCVYSAFRQAASLEKSVRWSQAF